MKVYWPNTIRNNGLQKLTGIIKLEEEIKSKRDGNIPVISLEEK